MTGLLAVLLVLNVFQCLLLTYLVVGKEEPSNTPDRHVLPVHYSEDPAVQAALSAAKFRPDPNQPTKPLGL